MMSFLVAMLVILALSLSTSYIFQKKFEYTLPLVAASTSLIMYVTCFVGNRLMGVYIVTIASVISSAYLVFKLFIKHERLSNILKSSGLIYFLIILVCVTLMSRGFVFTTWDEFSHWGTILKNMYLTNGFGNTGDSTTLFRWYPPGESLFLSFSASFSNYFSEACTLAGALALSYAQFAIIFTKIKFNDWKKILIVSGIIFVTPLVFFDNFYDTIYVDAFLGIIFANILIFNLSYKEKDLFYAIYMSVQSYLLINTKQIGIGLAFIAFAAIFIDLFVPHIKEGLPKLLAWSKNNLNSIVYTFIPLVVGLTSYISWKMLISSQGIKEYLSNPSFTELISLFSANRPSYFGTTIRNYIHHFFELRQYGSFNLSFFLLSIILIFIIFYIHRNELRVRHNNKLFAFKFVVISGLYLYLGVILCMYLTAFDQYESTNLASVDRYLGTYYLCLLVLTLYMSVNYIISRSKYSASPNMRITALLILIFSIIPIDSLINHTILQFDSKRAKQEMRVSYDEIARYTNRLTPDQDKIFVISQNSSGIDYYVLRYSFMPIPVQEIASKTGHIIWSLGEPYNDGDQWTANLSTDQWAKILNSFTYVYLFKIDERFISDYGVLFDSASEIKDNSMYHIVKSGDIVILKRIAPTKSNA